jgi:excisionase family DNA binding protein
MNTKSPYMTVTEAARRLGMSDQQVRRLADTDRLPHVRTVGGLRLIEVGAVRSLRKLAAQVGTRRSKRP